MPEDLAEYPIIGYPPGTRSQARLDRYFEGCGIGLQIIHVSQAVPTNLQLATSGIGVAAVPEAIVLRELATGDLVPIKLKHPFVSVNYQAVFLRDQGQGLARAVAALARDVAATFANPSTSGSRGNKEPLMKISVIKMNSVSDKATTLPWRSDCCVPPS